MCRTAFGNMIFNIGWKTNDTITLFGKSYNIEVKLKAFNGQAITEQQIKMCENFCENRLLMLQKIENLIKAYGDINRFVPTVLLFQRNGDYALLFDDKQNIDEGIAVCLAPKEEILMLDQYL